MTEKRQDELMCDTYNRLDALRTFQSRLDRGEVGKLMFGQNRGMHHTISTNVFEEASLSKIIRRHEKMIRNEVKAEIGRLEELMKMLRSIPVEY